MKNLLRQGCEVFLPMSEVTQRKRQQFQTKMVPLFPGYLFVGLRENKPSWKALNSTYGVSRCVCFDGTVRAIPNQLIMIWKQTAMKGRVSTNSAFATGDIVEIQKGPFANFLAEIEHLQPDQRVWVLIDILGQKSRIEISDRNLKLAAQGLNCTSEIKRIWRALALQVIIDSNEPL